MHTKLGFPTEPICTSPASNTGRSPDVILNLLIPYFSPYAQGSSKSSSIQQLRRRKPHTYLRSFIIGKEECGQIPIPGLGLFTHIWSIDFSVLFCLSARPSPSHSTLRRRRQMLNRDPRSVITSSGTATLENFSNRASVPCSITIEGNTITSGYRVA